MIDKTAIHERLLYIKILWRTTDLNTKLRKTINGGVFNTEIMVWNHGNCNGGDFTLK
jgi:hypothetical protein